jgi:hypothetical protein
MHVRTCQLTGTVKPQPASRLGAPICNRAVPFGARFVIVTAFVSPAHARREREASVYRAVRCGTGLSMLAEKTNEGDAILAKHVFCLPFVPRFVGATRCEGGRSQSKRNSFSEGPGQIVCGVQKAQPAICRGNRNPAGQELASEAAERGNYAEAKPNEERLKGKQACKMRIESLWDRRQNHDDIRTAHSTAIRGFLFQSGKKKRRCRSPIIDSHKGCYAAMRSYR